MNERTSFSLAKTGCTRSGAKVAPVPVVPSERRRPAVCEALERRRLFAVTVEHGEAGLLVRGDDDPNTITVSLNADGKIVVEPDDSGNGPYDPAEFSEFAEIHVLGKEGADIITVDEAIKIRTLLTGSGGVDTIKGGGGEDWIYGGSEGDTLEGRGGEDVIKGDYNDTEEPGGGDDTISGGAGDDRLYGGAGDDTISGGDDQDRMWGNAGNDTLDGSKHDDILVAGAGNDVVYGDYISAPVYGYGGPPPGPEGADTIYGGAGNDRIFGDTPYLEQFYPTALGGADILYGDDGDDTLYGYGGNDTLYGGLGLDWLGGDGGDDMLFANDGSGYDSLYGGDGNDGGAWDPDDIVRSIP